MSYPVGTPVHSLILPIHPGEGNLTSPVIVVFLERDGEVRNAEYRNYRLAQRACEDATDNGARILAVVEGETDLSTGNSTAWIRH